jgi:hypothetical protein
MRVTIESTTKVTRIEVDGHKVPARLWIGTTESGIPVHCYVTMISPQTHDADANAVFERELREQRVERELVSFDLRMIL